MKALWARPWLIGVLATAVLLVPHITLRSFFWRYEWAATIEVYCFSNVIIGPIAAAISCGWAVNFRRKSPHIFILRQRRYTAALQESFTLFFPIMAIWILGLIAVLLITLITSMPGIPDLRLVLPPISTLTFIYLNTLIGFLLGQTYTHYWIAPVVGFSIFFLTTYLYNSDLSILVNTGGATSSLVGLAPHLSYYFLQEIIFISCITLAVWFDGSTQPRWRLILLLLICTLVCASSRISLRNSIYIAEDLYCQTSPSHRTYCVGLGYRKMLSTIMDNYEATLKVFDTASLPTPHTFTQKKGRFDENTLYLDVWLAVKNPELLNQTVIDMYPSPNCDTTMLDREFTILIYATGNRSVKDEWRDSVPQALLESETDQSRTLIQQSYEALRSCTPTF